LGQFAGLFSTKVPNELNQEKLSQALEKSLADTSLSFWIAPPSEEELFQVVSSEPYVITMRGPDRPDIIPSVTKTVASFDANIENLRAVTISAGDNLQEAQPPLVLVLEIAVPIMVQQNAFRQALSLTAEELGIEIGLQHRDIFEAIHRV
jgi:glycine cleavage system transcriptional repressor